MIILLNPLKKVSDNPSVKNLNPPTIKILSNNEDFNNVKSNNLVSKINLQKKYSKEIFSAINHSEKKNWKDV